jgi:inosose dehydratase
VPREIACFTNSYGRFGAEAAFRLLPSAGLTQVELAIKTEGVPSIFGERPVLTDRSGPADLDHVRRRLDEAGLMLSSCNVTSGNPKEPSALEITLRKLDLAASLGVRRVVAGGGQAETAAEAALLRDHLRRLGDAAAARGLIYCCETHPGLCQNGLRMRETMEAVDHPAVGLNFDTGNILYYNPGADLLSELQHVAALVRHVHLKDHNGCPGSWHFPALGSGGAVNFAGVRAVLDACGFCGPYSLEIEGLQGEPPLSLEATHQRVVDSVAHLRRCGYWSELPFTSQSARPDRSPQAEL